MTFIQVVAPKRAVWFVQVLKRTISVGGYVPPGTPNWHPVLEKMSPKIDTPF